MKKWKVMISAPYLQPHVERFRPIFEENNIELFVPPVFERFEEADLLPLVGEVDGVICGDDRFTERVLAAAPKLKVLSKWGTGIDSLDKAACQAHGVVICNTPNAFTEPVADSIFAYMLCFSRRTPWMDRHMKGGGWEKIPGRALHECTLGIIGVGNIGKAVTRRAKAFNMTVLGNDIIEMPAAFVAETGIQMVSKAELLAQADFISLNCDLNPSSYHILSTGDFEQMKPLAVVINTARGPLVDETALVQALQTGTITGAALDVFEHEPLPLDSPLRQMENVLLAPHNSNSSPAAWERVHHSTIHNLIRELKKHEPSL